jgi:CubicO group peptidase (beta-lactamase class C family)
MLRKPVIFLLLVLLAGCREATEPERDPSAALDERLQEIVRLSEISGLSIAVVRVGEPVWVRSYGVRHTEIGEPVQEDTLFEAASLSKPVFAYAVHRLAERNEIDLDKPLWVYLPYERLEHDERYKKITARMVLSHSGGLPNWGGTPLEMISEPGERFNYSGEGFVYLQKVVTEITGSTLNEVVTREVFGPLGMSHSSYLWSDEFSGRMATGHTGMGDPMDKDRRAGGDGNAAASLLATAGDYGKFVEAVLHRRGLEPFAWDAMLSPRVQVVDRSTKEVFPMVYWGLGVGVQRGDAGDAFFHWGHNPGYRSYVIGYPERGVGLVYFTNSDDGLSIAEAIVDELVHDSHDALRWLDYEEYDAPGRLVRRSLERAYKEEGIEAGNQLYRKHRAEQPDLEYEPLMNSLGYALLRTEAVDEAIAVFELNVESFPDSSNVYDSLAEAYMTAGKDELAIENYERSLELDAENSNATRRLAWIRETVEARNNPVDLPEADLQKLAGRYGMFDISLKEGRLYATADSLKEDYPLVPISKEEFLLEGFGVYRLEFVFDGEGRPTKLIGHHVTGRKNEADRDP